MMMCCSKVDRPGRVALLFVPRQAPPVRRETGHDIVAPVAVDIEDDHLAPPPPPDQRPNAAGW